MTVRVVKEEPFEEKVVPLNLEPQPIRFVSEEPEAARAVPTEPVGRQAAQVQAVAVLTALAAVITPKLVLILAVISSALLTFYAETREHDVLAVTSAGLFDGLTLVLAFAKGEWRR